MGHDLDCCFMRIKNTGNNRTFGAHKRMDKRWKLLKFREPGSIGRKTQKPSSCFIGLLLFSFIISHPADLVNFFPERPVFPENGDSHCGFKKMPAGH